MPASFPRRVAASFNQSLERTGAGLGSFSERTRCVRAEVFLARPLE